LKRKHVLLPAAILCALALTATAFAASHGTTVKARSTNLGNLLATHSGHLLYVFAPDKRNKDVCVRKAGCTQVWPPLTTGGKPVGANGVKSSKLGTIKLPDGKKQVTYAGHPLYMWIEDPGHGDTSYVGVDSTGGKWWAINTAGKIVKG
jgi:predicted lipoprotein with Yx(FWY)xxD motif